MPPTNYATLMAIDKNTYEKLKARGNGGDNLPNVKSLKVDQLNFNTAQQVGANFYKGTDQKLLRKGSNIAANPGSGPPNPPGPTPPPNPKNPTNLDPRNDNESPNADPVPPNDTLSDGSIVPGLVPGDSTLENIVNQIDNANVRGRTNYFLTPPKLANTTVASAPSNTPNTVGSVDSLSWDAVNDALPMYTPKTRNAETNTSMYPRTRDAETNTSAFNSIAKRSVGTMPTMFGVKDGETNTSLFPNPSVTPLSAQSNTASALPTTQNTSAGAQFETAATNVSTPNSMNATKISQAPPPETSQASKDRVENSDFNMRDLVDDHRSVDDFPTLASDVEGGDEILSGNLGEQRKNLSELKEDFTPALNSTFREEPIASSLERMDEGLKTMTQKPLHKTVESWRQIDNTSPPITLSSKELSNSTILENMGTRLNNLKEAKLELERVKPEIRQERKKVRVTHAQPIEMMNDKNLHKLKKVKLELARVRPEIRQNRKKIKVTYAQPLHKIKNIAIKKKKKPRGKKRGQAVSTPPEKDPAEEPLPDDDDKEQEERGKRNLKRQRDATYSHLVVKSKEPRTKTKKSEILKEKRERKRSRDVTYSNLVVKRKAPAKKKRKKHVMKYF